MKCKISLRLLNLTIRRNCLENLILRQKYRQGINIAFRRVSEIYRNIKHIINNYLWNNEQSRYQPNNYPNNYQRMYEARVTSLILSFLVMLARYFVTIRECVSFVCVGQRVCVSTCVPVCVCACVCWSMPLNMYFDTDNIGYGLLAQVRLTATSYDFGGRKWISGCQW